MHDVVLPELGEGIEKAMVACWNLKQGDHCRADDDIVELVTDKASFGVTAGQDGVVAQILVSQGQEAKIGQVLARIQLQKG